MPMPSRQNPAMLGSFRCSLCSINYPKDQRFSHCVACEEPCTYFSNVAPHPDWLDLAAAKAHELDGDWPEAIPEKYAS
jgi:hypothetical protein